MTLKQRHDDHCAMASTAIETAADHGDETAALYRIIAAIHEVGATIALAGTPPAVNEELELLRAKAMDDFKEVLERHQEAIYKAHQGLSPWGEIKMVGDELQTALGTLRGLL